ncbi:GIY-YIG nuclease family protein [Pacificimonas flava]|uniref:Excinuclease ABC, C subunit domain protein n=1 Tax=Pacificimonas flava TaxID=1234595 RepID=M2SBG7_9SPHN|nr:GIY-YIG nuclease family protein [Pacificimonas flava]EMD82720.1 Excinuclease ABC, C subunit domain protein [Pacificimonas flava]MBB5279339.1 putative endonuclease [Pacificimonas flava]
MTYGGHVYIMTNRRHGTLYTGVTADLPARVYQHRIGKRSSFCRKWNLTRLVWYADFDRIEDAIAREKQIKAWKRAWKIREIESLNPRWDDLYEQGLW